MTRDSKKTLTQEQKEAVIDFVADWIKSGKPTKECIVESMRSIEDGDISYNISMCSFGDRSKLFSVSVVNDILNLRIVVLADEIINKSSITYIENYMIGLILSDTGELTNDEFNKITGLEVDPSILRAKKILHIKGNL
jgi:hypothetical protein